MKKLMLFLMAMAIVSVAKAEDRPIDYDQIPAKAKQFVSAHFAGIKVLGATIDKEVYGTTYDVYMDGGRTIEFDKKGEWKEIDCQKSPLPAGVVPAQIAAFVKDNHVGKTAVKISRDKRGYEVKLNNGSEIKFDSKFRFMGYDD